MSSRVLAFLAVGFFGVATLAIPVSLDLGDGSLTLNAAFAQAPGKTCGDGNSSGTEIVNDACDSTMRVAIDTSAEDAFIIDFMGFFAPGDLLAVEVSMRKELEQRCVV